MKKVLVFRHLAFESLGVLDSILQARGIAVQYVDVGVDDFNPDSMMQADLLIVLGGPIGLEDVTTFPYLQSELDILSDWMARQKPILGICLGAQLMASVLGAKVRPMGLKEIGLAPIGLTESGQVSCLSEMDLNCPVLHWHGDQFDIPEGSERLAFSEACPNQGFSVGDWALGLQFHLEADLARIEQWLIGHFSELKQAGIDIPALRTEAKYHRQALARQAENVFQAWLKKVGL